MHSADAGRRRGRRWRTVMTVIVTAMLANGCAEGLSPLTSADAPQSLTAQVLRPGAVTLKWTAAPTTNGAIRAYVVERRVNSTGAFTEVGRIDPPFPVEVLWIDTDVQPSTIYGYRVYALTALGDRSPPSTIGGAVTPPSPGIEVTTKSSVTSSESLDPDGYIVTIMGSDTVRSVIGASASRRFSPLRPGTYTVALSGLIERCSATAPSKQVVVTDTSVTTITPVEFDVTCRDPNRGDLTVVVRQTGDVLDQSISVDVLGQASDSTLPTSERVFSAQRAVSIASPSVTLANVRPGTYTVSLKDLASNCTLTGAATRTAAVAKLSTAAVEYVVACRDTAPPPPVSNAPFVWRNKWRPKTGPTNSEAVLEASLDLTAQAGRKVKGVFTSITYDPAVLQYESFDVMPTNFLNDITVGNQIPGLVNILAATQGAEKSGVVGLFTLNFKVIGASGAKSATGSRNLEASNGAGVRFDSLVRVVEDTFTVGSGGGGATNVPPVARAGGPYTGTAGTPLALSGAASSDADGSIAGYAWTFGDNTTGTGVSPSKTYATAGTYTATLTVTDDKGATATSTAQVTIASGGAAIAPVARANGPYTTTVGVPVALSSAGSTNATSFSWNLGNGQTATGASPSVTYASAGTFTITLTATGSGGVTSTSTTSMIVNAAAPPPSPSTLEWKNLFGPLDVANNTVSITILYDTRVNIAETPGAEALEKFSVDSLKWDPSVLQFVSVNLGPNIAGTSNQVGATAGRLGLTGTISGAQQQGLITIATIRLRPVGTPNATTTTKTFLGALLGPSSTNFFSYNAKTTVTEGQFTVP